MKAKMIHENIHVLNLEKSLAFYREALGLEVKRTVGPDDGSWSLSYLGNDTTDARKAVSLTAFGGAKGYGISIMIEALTGLLGGGVFGPHLAPMYEEIDRLRNLSGFFLALDPSVFWGGGDRFLDIAQSMIDELHAQPTKEGVAKVLIPGDIEDMRIERNRRDGIPVPQGIHDYLKA